LIIEKDQMRIFLLGAGAMGSLFGARLRSIGLRPVLYGLDTINLQTIAERGLKVDELDGTQSVWDLDVCLSLEEEVIQPDVVLVVVKAYATGPAVASILPLCHDQTVFVTVQNGMGNWDQIAAHVPPERIVAGVTAQGATRTGPGHIRHGGNGPTVFGSIGGEPSPVLHDLVRIFHRAGMDCEATDRVMDHIWAKLLVNVGINAVTALAGVANGWIAQCAPARDVAQEAVKEAMEVARARGAQPAVDTVDRVMGVAQATAVNHSSMLQDVRGKNRTEVEAINGIICRWGREADIPTPVNRVLTDLIQVLEYKNQSRGERG
jgi:2-dehydropantoate 2-reductase